MGGTRARRRNDVGGPRDRLLTVSNEDCCYQIVITRTAEEEEVGAP